jgi:hypothetical protein
MLRSRYECKYLIPPPLVDEIRRFIEPFMVPDVHARRSIGNRYPICSLYFDTLDLHLYRQTAAGEKNRFKLRVRSYSDDPATPVFLEVKRRVNNVILKSRARLPREAAVAILDEGDSGWLVSCARELLEDLEAFSGYVTIAAARPFMRVRYQREAYESLGGDPLRITLDTKIAWLPTSTVEFGLNGKGWIPTPVPGTVLEIKFTDRYPAWVGEMIRTFGLNQQSVAKYVLSVDSYFADSRERGIELDGSPAPRLGWDGRPAWAREA